MRFEELKRESHAFKCYELLKAQIAADNLKPFRCIRIDGSKKSLFIICCKTDRNIKKLLFKVDRWEAPFLLNWIGLDFPFLEYKHFVEEKRKQMLKIPNNFREIAHFQDRKA